MNSFYDDVDHAQCERDFITKQQSIVAIKEIALAAIEAIKKEAELPQPT